MKPKNQCHWKKWLMLLTVPLETRVRLTMWGHRHPEAEAGARERFRPISLLGFPWEVTTWGLVILNNFDGLWGIGVVPSYLSSGSEMIKAEKYCHLGSSGQIKKVWFWISCLYIKGMLPVESFALSKKLISPTGDREVFPKRQERLFKMSKHHNI